MIFVYIMFWQILPTICEYIFLILHDIFFCHCSISIFKIEQYIFLKLLDNERCILFSLLNTDFIYPVIHFYNPRNCVITVCVRGERKSLVAERLVSGGKTPVSLSNNKKLKAFPRCSTKQCKQIMRSLIPGVSQLRNNSTTI